MVKDHLDSERGNPLPPHGMSGYTFPNFRYFSEFIHRAACGSVCDAFILFLISGIFQNLSIEQLVEVCDAFIHFLIYGIFQNLSIEQLVEVCDSFIHFLIYGIFQNLSIEQLVEVCDAVKNNTNLKIFEMVGVQATDKVARVSTTEKGQTFLFNDALNTFYLRLYGVEHP